MKDVSYVISVRFKKGCYRHIRIDGQYTLLNLALAILDSFDFDYDHLNSFYMDNKRPSDEEYQILTDPMMPIVADKIGNDYTLNELHLKKGQKFKYIYHFGPNWTFNCRVENFIIEEKIKMFYTII